MTADRDYQLMTDMAPMLAQKLADDVQQHLRDPVTYDTQYWGVVRRLAATWVEWLDVGFQP